jgi:phosphonate transport system permease protein
MATIVAVPLSFLLSFPAARNVMTGGMVERTIYVLLRAILNIMRSMEPIIWAIIFSVWVGIGPFAGMLALVVHTVASLTKQYSEQIEDVDHGPIEAISATGANRLQVLWFAVVPQCVIPFLSFTIYRWDINVRMATIIGFVGGGGIGTLLTQYQGLAKYNEVGTLVILITLVVWILDVASARVREALR